MTKVLVVDRGYTSSDLEKVSMYRFYFTLARYNADERQLYYIVVPRRAKNELDRMPAPATYEYDDSYLESLERKYGVRLLSYGLGRDVGENELAGPVTEDEWHFFRDSGFVHGDYDVVLARYGLGTYVRMLSHVRSERYSNEIDVPIVSFLHETGVDRAHRHLNEPAYALSILSSVVVFEMVFVFNEADKKWLKDLAYRYLSSSMYREVVRKPVEVVRPLFDEDEFTDDMYEESVKARVKRLREEGDVYLFHAGSLEAKRRLDIVYRKIKQTGLGRLKMLLCISNDARKPWLDDYEVVKFYRGLDRTSFLKKFAEGDVGLCLSKYEGTGIANIEMMASGMPMIVWREMWNIDRVPKGYPWIVSGDSQLLAMLQYVSGLDGNLSEYVELSARVREFAVANFGRSEGKRIGRLLETAADMYCEKLDEKAILLGDLVRDVAESLHGDVYIDDVYDEVAGMSRSGNRNVVRNWLPTVLLKQLMRKFGYVDIGGFGEVLFRKG